MDIEQKFNVDFILKIIKYITTLKLNPDNFETIEKMKDYEIAMKKVYAKNLEYIFFILLKN